MELEDKIKSELRRLKIRHRGVDDLGGRFIVRAEVSKGDPRANALEQSLRRHKLRRVTGAFGRWEFRQIGS